MNGRFLLSLLLVGLSSCGSPEAESDATTAPTALVTTVAARRGTATRTIQAYGEATPASNAVVTLNMAQPGQITHVFAVPGARVRAGDPVLVFTLAPAARSSYQQALDAVKAAESQRGTTAQLLAQQLATRDQLVQADKAVLDARAALAALRKDGAGTTVSVLRAPVAGVIATLPVAPGDRTQPGQALATIARAGGLIVTVGVDPVRRADLRPGAPVTLSRLDGGVGVTGHVQRIDAALNPRTRQIDVDIACPAGAILAGEAMKVAIATDTAQGWRVPHRAVVIASDGHAQLFQIVQGKARAVPVTVAVDGTPDDLVTGALDARARVIVDGAYQVADGDAVRVAGPR